VSGKPRLDPLGEVLAEEFDSFPQGLGAVHGTTMRQFWVFTLIHIINRCSLCGWNRMGGAGACREDRKYGNLCWR
jgi:hypothetical protein